ncbi:MAG: hypothetical protein H6622_05925 [Halobacteriovoraceae bacterium]|nr:hypothetical protein [Halobacteriovoraceae bacterium]
MQIVFSVFFFIYFSSCLSAAYTPDEIRDFYEKNVYQRIIESDSSRIEQSIENYVALFSSKFSNFTLKTLKGDFEIESYQGRGQNDLVFKIKTDENSLPLAIRLCNHFSFEGTMLLYPIFEELDFPIPKIYKDLSSYEDQTIVVEFVEFSHYLYEMKNVSDQNIKREMELDLLQISRLFSIMENVNDANSENIVWSKNHWVLLDYFFLEPIKWATKKTFNHTFAHLRNFNFDRTLVHKMNKVVKKTRKAGYLFKRKNMNILDTKEIKLASFLNVSDQMLLRKRLVQLFNIFTFFEFPKKIADMEILLRLVVSQKINFSNKVLIRIILKHYQDLVEEDLTAKNVEVKAGLGKLNANDILQRLSILKLFKKAKLVNIPYIFEPEFFGLPENEEIDDFQDLRLNLMCEEILSKSKLR